LRKANKYRELLLQKKRERKRLKRTRLNKSYKGDWTGFYREQRFKEDQDRITWNNFKSILYEYFAEIGFINGTEKARTEILIPENFSFCQNYENSVTTIRDFIASIFEYRGGEILIDFSDCNFTDQSALFVLQTLRYEFQSQFQKLDERMSVLKSEITINIKKAGVENVNKLLLLNGILPEADLKTEGLMPITTIGYLKGNRDQKHYSENRKGPIVKKIVAYLNSCLAMHGLIFSPVGLNNMDGLISEILNNAEDHSEFSTYYISANMLREVETDHSKSLVGEVNLSIMNFGFSYYDGFEHTKNENFDVYNQMEVLYDQVRKSNKFGFPFTRENLFTLYALQPGMSRIKYQEESRGTGTMKFISSFFSFGDYEDPERCYHPSLSLISGKTMLICDNKYRPFEKNGVFFVSLNPENDLREPPNRSNLKSLQYHFPGTILSAKIYLNKDHLLKKLNGNDSQGN